jgi:hypothetical protein
VVDDDSMGVAGDCDSTTSTFGTIPAAVTAATAGDTIVVCPGNYTDQVVVDRALTIQGAQAGKTGTACKIRSGGESRVFGVGGTGGTGAFWLQADDVIVDGFLIENNQGPGVQTTSNHSGFVIRNNVIRSNVIGVNLVANPAGTVTPSVVTKNCIANNNASGASQGNGIYGDAGTRRAMIVGNTFRHHVNSGITLIAGPGPVKNVTIDGNLSVNDRTFLLLIGAKATRAQLNTVRDNASGFGDAGSAIYVGGGSDFGGNGSDAITLRRNTINSDHFAGIAVRGNSDDVLIVGNTVRGTTRGIDVNSTEVRSSTIRSNVIRNVGEFGLFLRAGTTLNLLEKNTVSGSGTADCQDDSTGSGTAGTANVWRRSNVGTTDDPNGICTAP